MLNFTRKIIDKIRYDLWLAKELDEHTQEADKDFDRGVHEVVDPGIARALKFSSGLMFCEIHAIRRTIFLKTLLKDFKSNRANRLNLVRGELREIFHFGIALKSAGSFRSIDKWVEAAGIILSLREEIINAYLDNVRPPVEFWPPFLTP